MLPLKFQDPVLFIIKTDQYAKIVATINVLNYSTWKTEETHWTQTLSPLIIQRR